jgi:hypothetical protein
MKTIYFLLMVTILSLGANGNVRASACDPNNQVLYSYSQIGTELDKTVKALYACKKELNFADMDLNKALTGAISECEPQVKKLKDKYSTADDNRVKCEDGLLKIKTALKAYAAKSGPAKDAAAKPVTSPRKQDAVNIPRPHAPPPVPARTGATHESVAAAQRAQNERDQSRAAGIAANNRRYIQQQSNN